MRTLVRTKIRQGKPIYYGMPRGATLQDELGLYGMDGIIPTPMLDGTPPPHFPEFIPDMHPYPLPPLDENGNIIVGNDARVPDVVTSNGEAVNKDSDISKEPVITEESMNRKFWFFIGAIVVIGGIIYYSGKKRNLIK